MAKENLKVAIQGVIASFHDVAARKFFSNAQVTPIECPSFPILCKTLQSGKADYAVMAIENTIAGSILPNYALLQSFGFKILGETYLRIEMCLMGLPGQSLNEIQFVQSHPMAILQCQDFLNTLPQAKVIEASDTAESAMEIKKKSLKNHAAIASELAARTYDLEIYRSGIETDKANYTRFLALSRSEDYKVPPNPNKASLRFEVKHEPGALASVLALFHQHRLNMTKIQSLPIVGKPYQYGFHIDVEWDATVDFEQAFLALKHSTLNLTDFGFYRSGDKPGI